MASGAASVDNRKPKTDDCARGGFVFWMLIVMGLAAFAPCVLLPEWREYQAVRIAEQAEKHRLDAMQRVVERERHLLDAMQSDPAVIARLAQRDLHFYRPGDTTIAVDVPPVECAHDAFAAKPIELPAVLARTGAYLPRFNYDALFCDRHTRPILMAMSVGLIVTAIALFWRKPAASATSARV
jgi:cell division protein FtsB